jgi:hypothetical protein
MPFLCTLYTERPPRNSFPRFLGTITMHKGKLPLVKFDNGNAYEGEWLNGKKHGHGIFT